MSPEATELNRRARQLLRDLRLHRERDVASKSETIEIYLMLLNVTPNGHMGGCE